MFYINICVKYEFICKQYSCCSETCKMLAQKRKTYSSETLQLAVESVIKGETTLLQASKTFGVPRTTLADKVGGRHPGAYGGKTTLSEEGAVPVCVVHGVDWSSTDGCRREMLCMEYWEAVVKSSVLHRKRSVW